MGRILAIDYGTRRTGIAVTDTLQLIANGLATVRTADLMQFLTDYLSREAVVQIVIGMPRQMNGENSENAKNVQTFVKKFKAKFPDVPVDYYDERFTSVLAHRAMLDSGLRKKSRQNKALVDEISATIILQSYMESQKIQQAFQ